MRFIGTGLATIGRYGAECFALSLLLGMALPQFAAQARPLLPVSIFCFMVTTFLRADFSIILGLLRRPGKLLLAGSWLILAPVLLVASVIALIGRDSLDPGILLGLAILGAAPPIMSSPAVAILYGFEASLIIASVIGITILSPLISPFLVNLLAGQTVPLDTSVLMLRLLVFVGGGISVAMLLRRLLGREKIASLKAEFDGFGVVMYFIFAVAAMDGVTEAAMNDTAFVIKATAIAFILAFIGIVLAVLVLRVLPSSDRFMIGYGTAQRNMGLLVAALGAGVPKTTFLFFALAQLPIYMSPWLLKPLARQIRNRQTGNA